MVLVRWLKLAFYNKGWLWPDIQKSSRFASQISYRTPEPSLACTKGLAPAILVVTIHLYRKFFFIGRSCISSCICLSLQCNEKAQQRHPSTTTTFFYGATYTIMFRVLTPISMNYFKLMMCSYHLYSWDHNLYSYVVWFIIS